MEQNEIVNNVDTPPTMGMPTVDPANIQELQRQLEAQQNLPMAIVGGLVASLIGAAVWAGITVATKYQIGWVAVGVGFLVGYAVNMLGKGVTPKFGYIGAAFAMFGCLLGNLLSTCGFIAIEESLPFFQVASEILSQPSFVVEIMKETFSPMDVVFYGIALYEGYKFSFKTIAPERREAFFEN